MSGAGYLVPDSPEILIERMGAQVEASIKRCIAVSKSTSQTARVVAVSRDRIVRSREILARTDGFPLRSPAIVKNA
jgi:hypothetical protein